MGDPSPALDRIIALIKLTGKLVSLAYEHLWTADEVPKDLQALVDELQSLGKSLTGLKMASEAEATKKFSSSVIQELNAPSGPLSECAAELKRLHFKLDSGSARDRGEYMDGPSRSPGKIQILPHIPRIEKHKNVFTLALQFVNDHSKLSEFLVGYINVGEDNNPQTRAFQVESTATKRKETLDWLYFGEFESRYLDLQEKRLKGTGEWVLRSPIFQNWIKGKPGSLLLWGRAIAGAGKTYISSKIIDYIQTEAQTRNYAVAYVFFDFMERDQQKPKHVLSSLVKQLACQTQSFSRVCDTLLVRLNTEQLDPTLERLCTNLVETAKSFDRAFIVLDGFDDCDELTQRSDLLPIFHALAKENISVFLTSKLKSDDIQRSLQLAAKIDLSAKDEDIKIYIEHAIENSPRVQRLLKQTESHNRFVSELTACAGGMFLLVYVSMRSLCQQSTVKNLFDELQRLIRIKREDRLLSAYAKVIGSIHHQSRVSVNMALRIFTWLVKARRTLTVDELRVAISVEADQYNLEESSLPDKETMVDVCAGLVIIHERSNTVCLIHPTVKGSLLERLIIPSNADSQVAIACLTYLSFDAFQGISYVGDTGSGGFGSVDDILVERPFFDYAAKYLSSHINSCDHFLTTKALLRFMGRATRACLYIMALEDDVTFHAPDISPLLVSTLVGHLPAVRLSRGQQGPALRAAVIGNHLEVVRLLLENWQDRRFITPQWDDTKIWKCDGTNNPVLHLAARRGFTDIVQLLLDSPVGIDNLGREKQTALQEAVLGGHGDVVNLLIENGASIWSRDECGRTALHIAAKEGHERIVKELLKHCDDGLAWGREFKTLAEEEVFTVGKNDVLGIGVMASDLEGRTPLHLAAWGSHTEVIRLLLAKGADVSIKDSSGGAALHLAVQGGGKSAVQLLLQHGSDVLVQDNDDVTALHRAAVRGYTDIVKILLDNGADIPATQWQGLTALSISVCYGFGEVVELLQDSGAKFPIPSKVDEMLSDAARDGYGDIVKILLNNGANFSDGAIYDAAANGHDNLVKIFLEEGADISLRHVNRLSLLHVAAQNGHEDVVRLLLGHGADVQARDEFNQTPLHKAASGTRKFFPFGCVGSAEIVRLLLESGADISAEDEHRQTAFALAADVGSEGVVRILIANGSDIENQDICGNTALHKAALNGHTDVVKLLLDHNAHISNLNQFHQTSLLLAATAGHEKVVQLLLKSGADITDEDEDGSTLLHTAAKFGYSDVVSLLIDNGADVSERDEGHRTAFILAAEAGHHKVVALILQNGGDISDTNKAGETALFLAARNGSHEILKLLINEGVDIAEQNKEGQTALFVASQAGAFEVVQLLLENGADISERTADGETALFAAGVGCHQHVYELLIENGADPLARDIYGRVASLSEREEEVYEYYGW